MVSVAHSADRVFGPDCPTQRVYEEGAKDVALSSLTGLNCKSIDTFHSVLATEVYLSVHFTRSSGELMELRNVDAVSLTSILAER